ncbi:MAG: glycosyltransferase, partial [Elainellaceae cyanobacterium]
MAKSALIYCDDLLAYSATFVRSQAEALQEFVPHYAGIQRVEGLPLPAERTLVVDAGRLGKLWKLSYKLQGFAPDFFERAQKLQPSLVHAHFGPDGLRALPLAQGLNIPLLVTMHGYDVTLTEQAIRQSTSSHRTYLRHRSRLQKKATCFIAVSHFIQRTMLNQGFPPEKVKVHYIGVDTARFCPDSTVSREPVVLFTGRLVEKKGCDRLIKAMAQVQQVRPEVELVVIRDGPLRSSLEEQAKATLKRYRFLGRQSPEQVKAWMNRAQVFS